MKQTWIAELKKLGACREAIVWAKQYKSLITAWKNCERGDWMLWLAAKLCDRKAVVLAACECARLALKYVPEGETRPLAAIETAEKWARGEGITLDDVRAAAYAANAAYAAAYAAYAAAYAAYAANAYAASAYAASYAAYAASYAATLKQCAAIARKYFKPGRGSKILVEKEK